MLRNCLTFLAVLTVCVLHAQRFDFFTEEAYLRHPDHIEFGIGASNFLGDLGGKDNVGTNDFRDLEFTEFNFAGFVGYRHAFHKNFYGRVNFNYGRVSGNDKLTEEQYRNNRNLSFRSNIFEVDLMAELFMRIGSKKGHQYKLQRSKENDSAPWHIRASYLTVFGGVGVFHFNPKVYFQDRWIMLSPLSTEGQGLPNGVDPYKLTQLNIPIGFSYMVRMHRHWSFGIEATYRYTFTDYIDDVSTSYYNANDLNLYLGEQKGDIAAYLSNPAQGAENDGKPNFVTATGQQRGDETDNDGYFYALFKVDYLIINEAKFTKKKTKRRGNVRYHRRSRTTI